MEPSVHVDQVEQQRVLPTQGQLQTPVDHEQLGGLFGCSSFLGLSHILGRRGRLAACRDQRHLTQGVTVLVVRQLGIGQDQLQIELWALHVVACNLRGAGLDFDAGRQAADARWLGLAGEHVQQGGVLPTSTHLDAHIPVLPRHFDGGENEFFFKVRQLGVADIDDQRIVPIVLCPFIETWHFHERIQVHRGDLNLDWLQIFIHEILQKFGCVDDDFAAVSQLHRLAKHGNAHRWRFDHKLRGQKGQRVDVQITKEHGGRKLGQQRFKTAIDQRGQVDQVKELGLGPTHGGTYPPVVAFAAVRHAAKHMLVAVLGQIGIGENQFKAELRPSAAQDGAGVQGDALLRAGEPTGFVAVDTAEELPHAEVAPAARDFDAHIVLHATHGDGGEDDFFFLGRHGRLEKLEHIPHKTLGWQQFVPKAGLQVVDLRQVQGFTRAHVAVNAPRLAASFVVLYDHDLIAKGQFHFAVCAAVVHLQVVTVALFLSSIAAGSGSDYRVGHDGRGVFGLHGDGTLDIQGVGLTVVGLQHKSLRIRADHVRGQHQASSSAGAFAAGFVGGGRRERGFHAGEHVQVATQLELHRFGFGQGDQGVFITNVGTDQGIDGFEQHVLSRPAHGVEGQGRAHSGSARTHGGGVFSRDVGDVVGLYRQAAIGLHLALGQDGAARAKHHVIGDQGIDGHGCGRRLDTHVRFGGGFCFCVIFRCRALGAARKRRAQARGLRGADRDVACGSECHAVDRGEHVAPQLVGHHHAAHGSTAAAGRGHGDFGFNRARVGGGHVHIAAHQNFHGHGIRAFNGSGFGQQWAHPGLAGAADFVAGQHKAGRGAGRIGRCFVADGGSDGGPQRAVGIFV